MCFPQSPACVRRSSCGGGAAAVVAESRTWQKLLPPRLLQQSRKGLTRLRDWGRSRVKRAGSLVPDWVSTFLSDRYTRLCQFLVSEAFVNIREAEGKNCLIIVKQ